MKPNDGTFWTTPLFSAGFMMGLGTGFVCCVVAVQLPNDFIGRAGLIMFIAGVVTFAFGAMQLRKWRRSADKED